jgi:hypothetical protein
MTSSNIGDVIDSVDDVKDDLIHEFEKRVGDRMDLLQQRATQYVMDDANFTGDLASSIRKETTVSDDEIEFRVGVNLARAPYAAIVEFGSGTRTNTPWEKSRAYGMGFDAGSAVPMDYPFEAPDVPYNRDDPYSLQGYPKFSGFVGHIERWMKVKGITPEKGSIFISAVAIAAAIIDHGNYAHPYLRPAWFDTELAVKQGAKNALRNATR